MPKLKSALPPMVIGSAYGDLIEAEILILNIARIYDCSERPKQSAKIKRIAALVRKLRDGWQAVDLGAA